MVVASEVKVHSGFSVGDHQVVDESMHDGPAPLVQDVSPAASQRDSEQTRRDSPLINGFEKEGAGPLATPEGETAAVALRTVSLPRARPKGARRGQRQLPMI